MKNILVAFFTLLLLSLLPSCGVNQAFVSNHNQNSTQVHLSHDNFKVIDKVSGSAEVEYILMFGGMNRRQLFENAYSAMMDKANLKSGPRTVVNMITEEHVGGIPPFYYKRTITVSAHVIEFTK